MVTVWFGFDLAGKRPPVKLSIHPEDTVAQRGIIHRAGQPQRSDHAGQEHDGFILWYHITMNDQPICKLGCPSQKRI
jgi:hypothetical protein